MKYNLQHLYEILMFICKLTFIVYISLSWYDLYMYLTKTEYQLEDCFSRFNRKKVNVSKQSQWAEHITT